MATLRFIGPDGDLSNAANYQALTGTTWGVGTVPVNGDTLLLMNPGISITGGSTLSAVNLAELSSFPTWTGNIGSGSAALQLGTTTVMNLRGAGSAAYINGDTTTLNHAQNASQRVYLTSGTTTTLNAQSGYVHVGTSAVLTDLYAAAAEIEAATSGTAITNAYVSASGRLRTDGRGITTYQGSRGSVLETLGTVPITTATVAGGVWTHMSRGTTTTLNLMSESVLNVANTGEAATITSCRKWPNAIINSDAQGSQLTITIVEVGAQQYGTPGLSGGLS